MLGTPAPQCGVALPGGDGTYVGGAHPDRGPAMVDSHGSGSDDPTRRGRPRVSAGAFRARDLCRSFEPGRLESVGRDRRARVLIARCCDREILLKGSSAPSGLEDDDTAREFALLQCVEAFLNLSQVLLYLS